jgi:anti-sigma-K factor RskA
MIPRDPDIIDSLAAEYVLGTLRGPARRRFERWRASSPAAEERCRFWEEQLMYFAKGLRPIQPPAHVWRDIRARLNLSQQEPRKRPVPLLALAASVLLIIGLGSLLYWRGTQTGRLSEVATISAPTGVLWRVEIYENHARMVLRAGQVPTRPTARDYELWALPKGGAPVSLGVMPTDGTIDRALTTIQQQALANSTRIAVTIEPLGGSPSGKPTSKPIFVMPLKAVS